MAVVVLVLVVLLVVLVSSWSSWVLFRFSEIYAGRVLLVRLEVPLLLQTKLAYTKLVEPLNLDDSAGTSATAQHATR